MTREQLLCSIINRISPRLGNAVWATPQNLRFFAPDFIAQCVDIARPMLSAEGIALLDGGAA